MRLRVLGCSGGVSRDRRTTCFLLDDDTLIDCGTGVGELSLEEMSRLRHIFLTHTHLDHIAGLPLLIDTLYRQLEAQPLTVHALPESCETLKRHIFNWQIWPDFFSLPEADHAAAHFETLDFGEVCEIENGRRLEMIRVNHTVPTAGYFVTQGDSSFAFSGDTTTNDSLWDFLNAKGRLDLLLMECAFSNEERQLSEVAKHYCPDTLSEDIAKLQLHPQLAISHLKPGDEDRTLEELRVALPGFEPRPLRGGEVFEL
ncbi:MAG: 3',5'-cyclic-nucleotide phosphodiesterase [Gammaproteobacteria bacterium]